jgi:virginiamycin B lyase
MRARVAIFIAFGLATLPASGARAATAPLQFTRLAVAASRVAVAPDGSLWALSTKPAGIEKDVLHETGDTWSAVAGLTADSIAIGADGTAYASSGARGVFAYVGGTWRSLGGAGLGGLATGADGSLYALGAAADRTGDRIIWRRPPSGGWAKQSAIAAALAGSFDSYAYAVPHVGTLRPGGYYTLAADGAIAYQAPNAAPVRLPGSASAVAPVPGGLFALSKSATAAGQALSYFDFATGLVTAENERASGLAAGRGSAGPWPQLYVVEAAGVLERSPLTLSVRPVVSDVALPSKGSLPLGITAGPDGALWFSEAGTGRVGRITTSGKVTEHQVLTVNSSDGPGPFELTSFDGDLWFTTAFYGFVGRISPSGAVADIEIAKGSGEPSGIAAGPDGAVWFTDDWIDKVGRISASGDVMEYQLPVTSSFPQSIALGSDGALWFAENSSGRIGRITTSIHFSEYPIVPKTNHPVDPQGLTAGPDGALWFTEQNGNHIGRITTAGAITEYAVPTAQAAPLEIAAGPDGALWFSEYGANKIGRITTEGVITEYKIPTAGAGAVGIVTGPDGAVWFVEGLGDKIGRIGLH